MDTFYSDSLATTSLICWIVVFIPQVIENYQRKDTSSLSPCFIYLWLVGDLINLAGAILEHLLPTTILLSVYFIFCDLVLIYQLYLYNKPVQEMTQLLINDNENNTNTYCSINGVDSDKKETNNNNKVFLYVLAFLGIFGIIVWLNTENGHNNIIHIALEYKLSLGVLLGWTSTLLYWGARVPQIFKNYQRKSVEGLSMSLFLFCMIGNSSFSLSVLLHPNSKDFDFILKNLPWIMGSAGTITVDLIVFAQFYFYNAKSNPSPSVQSIA
ncbi:PQ-loop-domain-containing protein [Neoconidiobolus thromboides FSU 785]|nr:PQ-loop-domain-containing protein [Neoconidiobolus thromboides FSU 785]